MLRSLATQLAFATQVNMNRSVFVKRQGHMPKVFKDRWTNSTCPRRPSSFSLRRERCLLSKQHFCLRSNLLQLASSCSYSSKKSFLLSLMILQSEPFRVFQAVWLGAPGAIPRPRGTQRNPTAKRLASGTATPYLPRFGALPIWQTLS